MHFFIIIEIIDYKLLDLFHRLKTEINQSNVVLNYWS